MLCGCARILKDNFSNFSKTSIADKHERNSHKFKFPKAPASATRAQLLSSGAMHDRICGPICGTIHQYGAALGRLQNHGGPPSPAPHRFGFHAGGCCHIWDHVSYHAWHQNLAVAPALRSPELEETCICNSCARPLLKTSSIQLLGVAPPTKAGRLAGQTICRLRKRHNFYG